LFDEQFFGRIKDGRALAQILRAAGASAACSGLLGSVGRARRRHRLILDQLVRYLYYTVSFSNGGEVPAASLSSRFCDPSDEKRSMDWRHPAVGRALCLWKI